MYIRIGDWTTEQYYCFVMYTDFNFHLNEFVSIICRLNGGIEMKAELKLNCWDIVLRWLSPLQIGYYDNNIRLLHCQYIYYGTRIHTISYTNTILLSDVKHLYSSILMYDMACIELVPCDEFSQFSMAFAHCSLYTITTTATPHNNSKKPSDNNFYVFFVNHKTFPPNRIGRIGYETISNPEDNEDLSDAFHSVHPIPEFVAVIVWDILRTCSLLWVLRCWGLVYWGDNHISYRWNEFSHPANHVICFESSRTDSIRRTE